jgi:hypothetical protein
MPTDSSAGTPETMSVSQDDVGTAEGAQPVVDEAHAATSMITSERAAAWTFGIYVAAALPLLIWMGSYRWFLGDEWTFLTDRSVSLDDVFRAHNQHWSTIPVLAYRGLYSIVGLHAYWPYQLVVIVLHLTVAVLLRIVMRRAGVGPWIATVGAGVFVLFGPAEDNILWAFQMGFAGALVLGLTQLLLADHDGRIDRRDWWGLGVGLLCLITSGQALALIAATGIVCVIRGRWRAAAFHTVPLGVLYVVWFLWTDVPPVISVDDRVFTVGEYAGWMRDAAVGLFMGVGHFAPMAVVLVALLVAGLVTAVRVEGARNFLRRAAIPSALLVAVVVSMSAAAPSRFALGEGGAKAGRYVGVMVAMALPAFAVAADALSKRWRWSTPLVVAVLLIPLPFNIVAFGDDAVLSPASFRGIRNYVATLPDNPLTGQVPPWVRPNETLLGQPDMTVGWLLNAQRNSELPEPTGPMAPLIAQLIPIQLGVATVDGASADGLECSDYSEPLAMDPQVGDRWYFDSPVQVAGRADGRPATLWVQFVPTGVEITLPDLHLLLAPMPGETRFRFCR